MFQIEQNPIYDVYIYIVYNIYNNIYIYILDDSSLAVAGWDDFGGRPQWQDLKETNNKGFGCESSCTLLKQSQRFGTCSLSK